MKTLFFLSALLLTLASGKGQTYDDLMNIIKHDSKGEGTNEIVITEAKNPINKSEVIKKSSLVQDRYIASGSVIPMIAAHKDRSKQTVVQQGGKSGSLRPIPINYIRKPKSQQSSRYYFFLSTLLIFFTIFTIILACGLSVYFVLKSLFNQDDTPHIMRDNSEM